MRIYLDQFHSLVHSSYYPFYLLSGEDDTLLSACQEQLYGFLTKQGFSGPVYLTDPHALFSSQLSLFSQKEILVYTLPKISAEFTQTLLDYTNRLPCDIKNLEKVYVFLTGKLDKNQIKSKWVQCLESHGAVATLWPPEGLKLKKWLSDTARYFQVEFTPAQKDCISENLPNNLAEIYQLIKLIHFCFGQEPISDDLLYQLLCYHPQYSPPQLLEALLNRHLSQVIKISQYLCQQQKILLIIWWLTQLFDWWQPVSLPNTTSSPLKGKALHIAPAILTQIQLQLVDWKKQLFQIDLYSKNSQHIEAEYLLNQLFLKIIHTLSGKTGV